MKNPAPFTRVLAGANSIHAHRRNQRFSIILLMGTAIVNFFRGRSGVLPKRERRGRLSRLSGLENDPFKNL